MNKLKPFLKSFMASILVWIFPVIFLYAQNVKEVQFVEIFAPGIVLICCSIVFFVLGKILLKSWTVSGVFSSLLGILLGNFTAMLKGLQIYLPNVRYWHLLVLIIMVVLLIGKLLSIKIEIAKDIQLLITVVFGILIAFNLVTSIPVSIRKILISQQENSQQSDFVQEDTKGKSNIYYILCDEYASFEQLQEDFNFSNQDFRNTLDDLDFNISDNSHNDSDSTNIVMANIMHLNYVVDKTSTAVEVDQITRNGNLQKILLENGYTLRGIGDTSWLGIEGTLTSAEGAKTADGETFTQSALKGTFIGVFFKQNYEEAALEIINTFWQLKNMEVAPNSSVFTMFYVSAPHHPYYIKRDGSMNSPDKYFNSDGTNNESYIGEIEYVNSELKVALQRIIKQDPNSIIILCSDHGNRFGNISKKFVTKILHAVYYKGQAIEDIKDLSGINTMRFILNHEFNMNMPYVDLPEH